MGSGLSWSKLWPNEELAPNLMVKIPDLADIYLHQAPEQRNRDRGSTPCRFYFDTAASLRS